MNDWKKTYIDYQEYSILIQQFSKQIEYRNKIQEKPFDIVYAIPRGGLPIATHISHILDLDIIYEVPSIPFEHILIVDDIVDTGKVMIDVIQSLEIFIDRGQTRFTTASLFYKPRSKYKPDIYTEEVKNDDWIVFPWELQDEIPNRKV